MTALPFLSWLSLFAGLVLHAAPQQPAEPAQDPKLDNLVHASGYETAPLGSLGAVVERGDGPLDLVLVSGFGLGASVFEGFLTRNAARYHMLAITLAGCEGTRAPPMPPAGTSYGEQTWTNAAVEAVARLVQERGLKRPVLIGHFVNGTQVAARVALVHSDLVRALVLLAGTPRYEPVADTPYWHRGLTLEQKVAAIDNMLAPRWFKTVTRKTWVNGNFNAADYSRDEARGRTFAERANEPPLPVLIRYLCEFHASDLRVELADLAQPLLLIQPEYTAAERADPKRSYMSGYLEEPWLGQLERRAHTRKVSLANTGILLMDDEPERVDREVAEFLAAEAR